MSLAVKTPLGMRQYWYFPVSDRAIAVSLRRLAGGSDEVSTGALLDISCCSPPASSFGGIRVDSPTILRFEEQVEVDIRADTEDGGMQAMAIVRTIRPSESDDRWLIGCAFRQQVPLDTFESWVDRGILSRRSHVRHSILLAASASWEGRSAEMQLDLIDVGFGGFCLAADTPAAIGSRVHVFVHEPGCKIELKGEVRWRSMGPDGRHQIGCMFTGRNMSQAVNKIIDFYSSIVAEQ